MRRDRALVALTVFFVLAGACANAPASTDGASDKPQPQPSIQPVPGPPVANSRAMRDELLGIAARSTTTDTATAWGLRTAWLSVFPAMRFGGYDSGATSDTVSSGDLPANERDSELTATFTFAVVDGIGTCAGGYVSGPAGGGKPIRFDRVDPPDACTAGAVYLVRNPVPEPEPEVAGPRRSGGKSSGSSSSSGPQTRTGQIPPRDLGSNTVTRHP